jgi:lipoprotein-anchoring transpeptidase ErfK/SrfK
MLRLKLSIIPLIFVFINCIAFSDEAKDSTRIVISRNQKKLLVFTGNKLLAEFPIAVGKKDSPTPLGEFQIINKIPYPTWYPKGSTPVQAGKDNPLGTHWMGLSAKGYGIHGTNVPNSIGKSVSHGCIRMKHNDLVKVFQMVSVGTSVSIIDSTQTVNQLNPHSRDSTLPINPPIIALTMSSTRR